MAQDIIASSFTTIWESKINDWYEDEQKGRIREKSGDSRQEVTVELRSWEDLYSIPDTADLLSALERVPFYRYMIRYLIYIHAKDLENAAAGAGIDTGKEKWEESFAGLVLREIGKEGIQSQYLALLAQLVHADFISNHCSAKNKKGEDVLYGNIGGSKKWTLEDLLKILCAETVNSGDFFLLAFGLNMKYEDISVFLKKVLKRSDLNLWDPDEFLIYICFQCVSDNKIGFFREARGAYKGVKGRAEIFQKPEKTADIRSDLDKVLAAVKAGTGLEKSGHVTEELLEVLAGYKYLLEHKGDYRRTALKRANELLCDFKEQSEDDMEEYLASFKETQNFARGNVQVYYDSQKGVCVPAGTHFIRRMTNEQGETEDIHFISLADVKGEPAKMGLVEITVLCTAPTQKQENNKLNTGYLPNKSKLHTEISGVANVQAFHALAKPVKKKKETDYHVSGVVQAQCEYGTVIPKGAIFTANGYEYASTKEIVCETYVDVPVQCAASDVEATINQITEMEQPVDGVLRIGNTKISLRSVSESTENRVGGSLYRYLYTPAGGLTYEEQNINRHNSELLSEILEGTMLSPTKIWQIEKMKDIEVSRNDILTLSFLCQMSEIEFDQDDYMEIRVKKSEESAVRKELFEERYDEFLLRTNRDLKSCGFQGLYLVNPYDCLLAYLTTCAEPLTAFRNLWGAYLDYKNGAV